MHPSEHKLQFLTFDLEELLLQVFLPTMKSFHYNRGVNVGMAMWLEFGFYQIFWFSCDGYWLWLG